jgi:DNA repair exonuclease SbcCD ATPase subunit
MLAELNALKESISRFETSISATAQQLGERMTSEVTPLSQDVSSVKAAVDSLSSQVAAAASTETTNRLEKALAPLAAGLDELKASLATLEGKVATGPKELEDRVAEDVSRIGKEIAALKDALEQATSQPSAPKPAQAAGPVRGPKTDAVSVMKKALNNSGKAGRRVDALAKIAGVSEAQALEILAASGDFTVGTNSKGQHTARLAGK